MSIVHQLKLDAKARAMPLRTELSVYFKFDAVSGFLAELELDLVQAKCTETMTAEILPPWLRPPGYLDLNTETMPVLSQRPQLCLLPVYFDFNTQTMRFSASQRTVHPSSLQQHNHNLTRVLASFQYNAILPPARPRKSQSALPDSPRPELRAVDLGTPREVLASRCADRRRDDVGIEEGGGGGVGSIPSTLPAPAGYIVFTMNLIQGHYLSERRATQEQRVFKYAYKGYGIRILPSYVSSLSHSQTKINQISPSEQLFDLNMDEIRESSRSRTQNTVARSDPGEKKFRHCDLDSKYQVSSEPQGRSCLSSFSLFMRHVELWDMEQRGEVSIEPDEWANTTYEDSVLAYDDTPSYKWGP
ncbi:hypothetical protein R3P38DRAFT_3211551 [Favolaschia claudopus]|uniref:Uncharacterized protein n=1 Tax=Favolaschia claudopus TaxID=2862362 RepID=A0AAW0AF28_9AGAR